jgi:hypothetical protein
MIRAIDPITITTTDGKERKLLLSMGGIRRLKQKFGVKMLGELLERDAEEAGVPILFEALIEKGDLTEDQFIEILPADMNGVILTVMRLMGVSMPDPRPTQAETAPQAVQ